MFSLKQQQKLLSSELDCDFGFCEMLLAVLRFQVKKIYLGFERTEVEIIGKNFLSVFPFNIFFWRFLSSFLFDIFIQPFHSIFSFDISFGHCLSMFSFNLYIRRFYSTFPFDIFICRFNSTFLFEVFIWHLNLATKTSSRRWPETFIALLGEKIIVKHFTKFC